MTGMLSKPVPYQQANQFLSDMETAHIGRQIYLQRDIS